MIIVVSPEPLCGEVLCLLDAFNDVLVQPFVANSAVIALEISALLRLNVLKDDIAVLSPLAQLFADVFRAII